MSSDSNPQRRKYLSRRVPIPDLRERLELLFAKSRNPRIKTISALDVELKLSGERSIRQYYRSDRRSGIPAELLDDFLAVFRLRRDELLLPLEELERLLESTASHGRPPIGWYGLEAKFPAARVGRGRKGDVCFEWPSLRLAVNLVSERETAPLAAPAESVTLLNLRRREASKAFVLLQREFRVDVQLPESRYSRIMGLIEGSQLTCFQKPYLLAPTKRRLLIPSDGDPFYFDEAGRHSLWVLLLLGDVHLNSADVEELDSEDARTRREAAEKIYNSSRNVAPEAVVVLRADFDVVT